MTAKQGRALTEEDVRRALEAQGISGRLIPPIPTHAVSPDYYVENSQFVDNPLGFLEQINNRKGDRVLGTYQIVSRWQHPQSRTGEFQYAVRLTSLDGANYQGRSTGGKYVTAMRIRSEYWKLHKM
jgi:hypothetical protein